MSVKFSVVVPIYKVEPYLKKCVDSILGQTYKDFELILVDDGSPDRCPEICDNYAARDERVRVIHKENGGLVSARNTGIAAATGEYICYVDGDDWVSTDLLETLVTEGLKNDNPDMVIYGFSKVFPDREETYLTELPEGLYNKAQLTQQVYPYMMYDNRKPFCTGLIFPVAWNKIYRREFLLQHYCTDLRIRMGEDNAFVYECIWFADTVSICNKALYFYNQMNVTSMVHSYDAGRFENNRYLTNYLEERLGGLDPVLDEQINAFKAYWLIMAVFHEVKSGRPTKVAAAHIKTKLKENKTLKGIHSSGLPLMAKGYLVLLKLRLYSLTLIATKIVNKKRDN